MKFIYIACSLVSVIILIPLLYISIHIFNSFESFINHLWRINTLTLTFNTILLVGTVVLASVLIAVPSAILTIKSDLPFKKLLRVLLVMPIVFPSYIYALIFILAFGPKGLGQNLLSNIGIETIPSIYGFWGTFLCLTFLCFPYIFISVSASIMKIDSSYEEAAKSLGKSNLFTYKTIVLPLLKPSIIAGSILVGLYVASDFGAVSLLHFRTFSSVIYNHYETIQRGTAASLSSIIIFIGIIVLWFYKTTGNSETQYRANAAVPRQGNIILLGKYRWPMAILFMLFIGITLIIPVWVLSSWAYDFSTNYNQNFKIVYAFNSIYASLLGALTIVIISIPITILIVAKNNLWTRFIEKASYTGFVLPGIVVALSVVFFGINYLTPIYQTMTILCIGYLILFLPVSIGVLKPVLLQINPKLGESAKTLGASNLRIWKNISIPLMAPGSFAAFAILFMLIMKELPATLILAPLNFGTLATSIWTHSTEANFGDAAIYSLILLLITGTPMFILLNRGVK